MLFPVLSTFLEQVVAAFGLGVGGVLISHVGVLPSFCTCHVSVSAALNAAWMRITNPPSYPLHNKRARRLCTVSTCMSNKHLFARFSKVDRRYQYAILPHHLLGAIIMAPAELHSINQNLCGSESNFRDDLQIISMVFYLVGAELLSEQIRIRNLLGLGQSALDRVAGKLDRCFPDWKDFARKYETGVRAGSGQ